ncbi:phosphotransferase domain-containing protein [Psychromonas sp. CNPT3]|uniref:RNase RNM n=1 Tax=Psychromonas sp. CNPT3 TaxID=314282 RepID=UPI00006E34AF|nr:PHP domain-containing protein [Psychromonas sp. CNPT3]AGH80731.1 phosphotransferase domain-containing protein [Psychromonas sp. CNPT3]
MLIDLHSHSTASDGQLTPQELVIRAANRQVDILALTDHDTIDGLAPAHKAIADLGLKIKLINGIEITTNWLNHEIHVVGVNIDVQHQALSELILLQKEKREIRALEMGRRLAKANIEGVYEGAKALAGEGAITRAHFARYLVEQGVAPTFVKVFDKYLSRGNIGYVPHNWVDMHLAIEAIHNAGGQAILAHPDQYKLSNKWMRRLFTEFKLAGGDAMEVARGQQSPQMRLQLAMWSKEYGLLASQGSDFHFVGRWRDLGKGLHLPEIAIPVWQDWAVVDALKEKKS